MLGWQFGVYFLSIRMKRLSRADRERFIRKRDRIAKVLEKARRARRPKRGSTSSTYVPALRIHAPPVFDCDNNKSRSELVDFLASLRAHFRDTPDRTLLIDFSNTQRFISGGTLLFYAELTRLIEYRQQRVKVRCTVPANDRASQVLEQIGVYKLCGHRSHGTPTRHDVVHWRVARGHLVDNTICAPVIESFEGQLATPLVDGLLGGLAEAMANAVHHAYDSVRDDGLTYQEVKDWWMFSQAKDGYLSVVFCDLGVGIPATIPVKRPWLIKQMEAIGFPVNDANCIKEAINEGRSQTGLPGRGHGLGNIIDVVEKVPGGMAVVSSNRGRYDFRNGKASSANFRDSLMGTLIFWQVPLHEASRSSEA